MWMDALLSNFSYLICAQRIDFFDITGSKRGKFELRSLQGVEW